MVLTPLESAAAYALFREPLTAFLEEYEKIGKVFERVLLVDISQQSLFFLNRDGQVKSYKISTAKNGAGQEEGSGKTPLGLHCIGEKIGGECSETTFFESRLPKEGPMDFEKDYITARILWLRGLQPGINLGTNAQGKVVDSHDRYIYIHGTNKVSELGSPQSAGCVRMQPSEIVSLFQKVQEGDPVYIYV